MLNLLKATVMDVPLKAQGKILVLDSTSTINDALQVGTVAMVIVDGCRNDV